MTLLTDRNNVKPVLRRITVPVMVLVSRFWAIMTEQEFRRNQFVSSNSATHSMVSFTSFRMAGTKANLIFSICYFAFFSFLMTSLGFTICYFALLCLFVFFVAFRLAGFAPILIAIFSAGIFVEFRQRFRIFAFETSFCYGCFRHNRFSYKRLCLEPVAGTYQWSACFNLMHEHRKIKEIKKRIY